MMICKCCGTEVSRQFIGFYPNQSSKKFIGECGCLWNGRVCPDCTRIKSLSNKHTPRLPRITSSLIKTKDIVQYRKEYYRNNSGTLKLKRKPHVAREMTSRRRARQKQATPSWLTDSDKSLILDMYMNCPEGYHVDHIIPLNGRNVCGLHVPWNLQYLLAEDNMKKGNRLKLNNSML